MKQLARRDFLLTAAFGTLGIGMCGARRASWALDSEYIPALIVGSGFGGSVAALRLAEAGIDTLVLERGLRWPITDGFATFEKPDGRAAWLSETTVALPPFEHVNRFTGILERIRGNHKDVLAGAGVGGGSLVYNAALPQPRRTIFEKVFPRWIDYDQMDEIYYPRVRQIIKPAPIPDDILNTQFYLMARVDAEQARNAGFSTKRVEYGIDWDTVRREIHGKATPSCISGQVWYGLNSGAKKSVDKNYLAMAENTGKLQIMPLHVVRDIREDPANKLYIVMADEMDKTGRRIRQKYFACRYLFLAAGAVGTTELLVKARSKRTLWRLNEHVGRWWGANGDTFFIRAGLPESNSGTGGPGSHVFMEDNHNPFGKTGVLQGVMPPPTGRFVIDELGFKGDVALYVAMGIAPALGYFTYDADTDSAILNWPDPDDWRLEKYSKSIKHSVQTFNDGNPGTETALLDTQTTAHPLGGAGLGRACDRYGRLRGYKGLYVVDGAMVPNGSAGAVNPALTIAALAERSMERIIEYDVNGSGVDDEGAEEIISGALLGAN